jgi:hypothetical protein
MIQEINFLRQWEGADRRGSQTRNERKNTDRSGENEEA